MTSNLVKHDKIGQYIQADIPVWHRAYSFSSHEPDMQTLARAIKDATGIVLMREIDGEEVYGFITSAKIPGGIQGTCGWCLGEGQENTQHTCVVISLYQEHVGEEEEIEAIIQKLLQDHHENIQLQDDQTT